MSRLLAILRWMLLASFGGIYMILGYRGGLDNPPLASLVVGLAPLFLIAVLAIWSALSKLLALGVAALALALIALNLEFLRAHTAWVYFVQHAGAMLLLGLTFGGTLFNGHPKALCSQIACFLVGESLGEAYLRYTWRVTMAWAVFFFVMAGLSMIFFFTAAMAAWSLLANILTPILVGLGFAVEYAIRIYAFPDGPRVGLRRTIMGYRAFSRR